MDIKQQEEIMKEAQRVQEQLEKSGALKVVERINADSSIKNAVGDVDDKSRKIMVVNENLFKLQTFATEE